VNLFEIAFALGLRFPKTTVLLIGITAFGMFGVPHAHSQPGTVQTFAADLTPASWADALMGALGDPDSSENVRAVMAWERAEGGHWRNAAAYNPLNTTQPEPGSHSMNSVGVQAFTSWSQGLAATVTTLRNGRYGGILSALQAGNCAPCVATAVAASPWGTGRFPV
jgi:hypothetical protein